MKKPKKRSQEQQPQPYYLQKLKMKSILIDLMGLMCQPLPKSQGTHLYLYVVASISYVVDIFFRFKGRVVYNKRYQDNTNESSQGSATSTTRSSTARTSTESSFPSSSRGSSRRSARGSKSSEASSSVFDTSASYEPSVFSESWSTVVSTSKQSYYF